MAEGDILKAQIQVEKIRYYTDSGGFGIVVGKLIKVEEGEPTLDKTGSAVFKGAMPKPTEGNRYQVVATETIDPTWGIQYKLITMYTNITLDENDNHGKRLYLESLFTEKQVKSMYSGSQDPYIALLNKDAKQLTEIKGCGFKTAIKWINRFHDNYDKARIFVELNEYEVSAKVADKLLQHYTSPDIVIGKVKNNPYSLMDVGGIGWKKCDELALKGGMAPYCKERIEAYIKYYLESMAQNGFTCVYSNSQLLDSILEQFGEDIPDEPIMKAIQDLDKRLWWSDDKEMVGLKRYVVLEEKIAKELLRIRNGANDFKYDDWKEIIRKKELEQGWEYTEQQWEGIQLALKNQVCVITGGAGTGKSSIVAGMLAVLKDYQFAQCALAGRAAARLSEITHQEGYTIHRLLGYNPNAKNGKVFAYDEETPLTQNIIILDEISMVDGQLFFQLLRAIPTGAKLIMLGDVGQLESIGCGNIAHDMIQSPEIPSIELNKIHRQASTSAIVTESVKVRHGEQVIPKDWVGVETRGELQDLTYDCYSDKSNTFYKVMQYASMLIESGVGMLDMQVIVPIKETDSGTWVLNSALQELCNPKSEEKDELFVHYDMKHDGILRVGDKVINTQNDYTALGYTGQWDLEKERYSSKETEDGDAVPIYNGNIGIIEKINLLKEEILVNFIGIGRVIVKKKKLSSLLLGYAITCHKLQGSECDHVIFGIDFGSYVLLTKEMVYTAITRAKKHCYVVAQNSALRYAVAKNSVSQKQTLLQKFLYESAHPKLVF